MIRFFRARYIEKVMVMLDRDPSKSHVLAKLKAYSPLATPGCSIIAAGGMGAVAGGPRTQPNWTTNNPTEATLAFVADHLDSAVEEPVWALQRKHAWRTHDVFAGCLRQAAQLAQPIGRE